MVLARTAFQAGSWNQQCLSLLQDKWVLKAQNFRTEEVMERNWGLAPRGRIGIPEEAKEKPLVECVASIAVETPEYLEMPIPWGNYQGRLYGWSGASVSLQDKLKLSCPSPWGLEDHKWVLDIGHWAVDTTRLGVLLWFDCNCSTVFSSWNKEVYILFLVLEKHTEKTLWAFKF